MSFFIQPILLNEALVFIFLFTTFFPPSFPFLFLLLRFFVSGYDCEKTPGSSRGTMVGVTKLNKQRRF